MARSKYIYVAVWAERVGNSMPVAARTVKRELVDFIEHLSMDARGDIEVWRVPDGIEWGPNGRIHVGTGAEFLAKERPR
jgi:hypothetical protein